MVNIFPQYSSLVEMSHTKSGCDWGAAAEAGTMGEQVASERSEQATCIYI